MKKIFYLILVLGVVLTSCDPMDDIHAEIDAQQKVITGEINLTLSDDDYDDLDLSYGSFNSVDDAKTMIPGLLTEKYPVWGEGSLVTATFKWYNPIKTYDAPIYTLTNDEQNEVTGSTYGNFDRDYYIFDYLEAKYPNPSEGDFYSLRYDYYNGNNITLTDGFAYENGDWTKFTGFTEDQYNAMGESYPNFSSADEADAKIPIALIDINKYDPKEAGYIALAMYELYVGGGVTKSFTSAYVFDGTSWSKYNNVANETIKFGHDGTTWVPDNTIKYTLTSADYELVGNGNYGNFDVRAGKAEESEDVRLEKINTILLNNFPSDAEGQKYSVSYNVYNGANAVYTMNVIKVGSEYILQ
ncbi:hypothetical protein JBL43_06470 [Aureibaculum sp. A20]|uniref:DUF5017 domain-containing protein n=1 Tax=Aureibaculum flavum TaxID=2795986 RepID=A0ABS0WPG4_9FLAO|nr:hypothetical protein [Aureibaculum flavum]MBJ2173876.1 hypothetical protein [Aureibaculum flavum]